MTLLVFFSILLVFGAIGLLIGAFQISQEGSVSYLQIALRILFLFSCIKYPKELFPKVFQNLILLNPLYYLFDLLRLVWYLGIDYEQAVSIITPIHIVSTILLVILAPLISLYIFEKVYERYGITGY